MNSRSSNHLTLIQSVHVYLNSFRSCNQNTLIQSTHSINRSWWAGQYGRVLHFIWSWQGLVAAIMIVLNLGKGANSSTKIFPFRLAKPPKAFQCFFINWTLFTSFHVLCAFSGPIDESIAEQCSLCTRQRNLSWNSFPSAISVNKIFEICDIEIQKVCSIFEFLTQDSIVRKMSCYREGQLELRSKKIWRCPFCNFTLYFSSKFALPDPFLFHLVLEFETQTLKNVQTCGIFCAFQFQNFFKI